MTLRELSGYFNLQQKIRRNQEMLESLESRVRPGAQALTGLPHGSGISDKVGDLAVEIAELKAEIARLNADADAERKKLECFFETIEDSRMRLICRLRFVRCLTWGEIAAIIGGNNTEWSIKNSFYRFLKEQKK